MEREKTPKKESFWQRTVAGSVTVANILQGVVALVVLIPLVVAGVRTLTSDDSVTSGPRPSTSSNASTSPDTTTASGPQPADCWDDLRRPVDCALDHRYEAMTEVGEAVGDCSDEAALAWLGYDAGIDVVRFELDTTLGGPRCVVDGLTLKRGGDFAGVLESDDSGPWRWCVSGDIRAVQTLKPVACDLPHVGEYIGAPTKGIADQPACETALIAFLGRADTSELTVFPVAPVDPHPATPRCLATITSGRPLVSTLRSLGNENLPRGG